MDRNLRLLGVGAGIRLTGNALYGPFLGLFLHNVLGIDYFEIGVIILGVGGVQVPFALLGGLLTDRWGRWKLIVGGLAIETAATVALAYGFAIPSLPVAIVAASAGGIAATAAGPAISAYVSDFAEGHERTLGFTWLRIGYNVGFAGGTALGGVLIAEIGFAGAVYVAAAFIAGGTAFIATLLEPSPFDRHLPGVSAQHRPFTPGAVDGPVAASTVTGRVPASEPATFRESLRILSRDRPFLEFTLAFGLAALVVGQWSFALPLFSHSALGIPYSWLGLGLSLNGLLVVFGQSGTTAAVTGRRHTSIAIAGVLLYLAAFALIAAAGEWRWAAIPPFFVAVAILTFGENLATIPQTTLPSNLAPAAEVGAYNGAFQVVTIAGILVSSLFGGWVLSTIADPVVLWTVLLLPGVPALFLFAHAAPRLPPAANLA